MAVNLAMVFAQSAKEVVIVDADMRRPMIHRYFGLSNRLGLSDVIIDSVTFKAVEHPWKDTKLSIITSGSLPANPSEFLGSENMLQYIEELGLRKYVSIKDSPPFLVSDATFLAANVDGVILVVHQGKTSTSTLAAALEQLARVNANVLGIVFNRIPRSRGYYYDGYQQYSNKYYSKGNKNLFNGNHGLDGKKTVREKLNEMTLKK